MAFVAMASDGSDGPTDAAGAAVDDGSAAVMIEIGDLDRAIARADAYPLLDDTGLLLRSGPTGTNLLDLHLLAVG
jgi:hydroxypyruvate reductase